MGTLLLALNLAQLFQTSSYDAYRYRIRFCWWGAEENSLLGAYHHVEEANVTTVEGNRLADYMLMLNFDMLASPNYYFGIYNPASLPSSVSSTMKNTSNKISHLFRQWFDNEKLPWDHSAPIISDYVPFLFAGVPASGLFSGDEGSKTLEQRDRYDRMLGHGHGGIAGVPYDPCYHMPCDNIANINPFAYETMVKSAAHVLETLARMSDLQSWLYSDIRENLS